MFCACIDLRRLVLFSSYIQLFVLFCFQLAVDFLFCLVLIEVLKQVRNQGLHLKVCKIPCQIICNLWFFVPFLNE